MHSDLYVRETYRPTASASESVSHTQRVYYKTSISEGVRVIQFSCHPTSRVRFNSFCCKLHCSRNCYPIPTSKIKPTQSACADW